MTVVFFSMTGSLGLPSARQVLCGDAPRPFFYHFSVHLSSVLGRTELCHEIWTPGPQKPQDISNENHHLALIEFDRQIASVAKKLATDTKMISELISRS